MDLLVEQMVFGIVYSGNIFDRILPNLDKILFLA